MQWCQTLLCMADIWELKTEEPQLWNYPRSTLKKTVGKLSDTKACVFFFSLHARKYTYVLESLTCSTSGFSVQLQRAGTPYVTKKENYQAFYLSISQTSKQYRDSNSRQKSKLLFLVFGRPFRPSRGLKTTWFVIIFFTFLFLKKCKLITSFICIANSMY